MQDRKGAALPRGRVLLLSEQVSQYRCMNLPKTNDNDRTHKNYANTLSLDIWSILLPGCFFSHVIQEPHASHLFPVFWNFEDPVLVETLSFRRKITYHPLLIVLFS